MKKLFQILIYASILFLLIRLIKTDFLSVPQIKDYRLLFLSIIFLIAGFLFQGITWKIILINFNVSVSYKSSIISDSLCVFMKYIPGKILSVLGRASYISNTKSINLFTATSASFFSQILVVWTGLILGIAILLSGELPPIINISAAISIIFITLILIYPDFFVKFTQIIAKVLKKEITLNPLSMSKLVGTIPYFFTMWLFWGVGFYFFSGAIAEFEVNLYVILAFPFATSLAIIVLIAPGGIGIREGTLFGCLILLSFPISEASSIAISSRIWFLFGEFIYFMTGLALKNYQKNRYRTQ
jgi:glycosyltransferase 2 family protein